MSVIFEGIEMPKACCFVDGEHTPFAHFEYCKFYKICKQRETIETNFRPNDCPVKPMNQEMISNNELGVECISREQAKVAIRDKFKDLPSRVEINTILNELPSVTPQPCEDAVSRQEVLNLIADYDLSMGQVVKGIHALPPVTPQEPQSFKWCTDCKEYDQEKHCCHRWSKVIRDTVEEMKQEQESILDKIRAQLKSHLRGVEITLVVLVENDPLRPKMEGAKDTLEECLELIDKVESEDKE